MRTLEKGGRLNDLFSGPFVWKDTDLSVLAVNEKHWEGCQLDWAVTNGDRFYPSVSGRDGTRLKFVGYETVQ